MRIVATCAIVVGLWGTSALPQALTVRSGEHDNFTRLVVPIPDNTSWRLESAPELERLIFLNHSGGFDLSQAFDVIPRTRLTALIAQDSVLEMQLACDCSVDAFEEANGFLVIDISDGDAAGQRTTTTNAGGQVPRSGFGFGELLWSSQPPLPDAAGALTNEPQSQAVQELQSSTSRETEIIRETNARLAQAFADAATRGLIEKKPDAVIEAPKETGTRTEDVIFDSSQTLTSLSEDTDGGSNIRISSSSDIPNPTNHIRFDGSGAVCPDDGIVDVASWASNEDFSAQLAKLSSAMFDDLGRPNQQAIADVAKLYLHFGFGAEAKNVLNISPDLMAQYPEIIEIADIFEHGAVSDAQTLTVYADCSSDLALWGILATPFETLDQPIDAKAALRAIQDLPPHLKPRLARALSERLLRRGDLENASIAKRSFEVVSDQTDDSSQVIDVLSSELRGDVESANEYAQQIVDEGGAETPEAMSHLVNSYVERDEPVPADLALLAESYAFELRNEENALDAYRTFVMAAVKSAQFGKSFEALENAPSSLGEASFDQLADFLMREFFEHAADGEFARGFFENYAQLENSLSEDTRVSIANRLLDLGFIIQAGSVLTPLRATASTPEYGLARARFMLETDRPLVGLAALQGYSSQDAWRLRGEILLDMGQNLEAERAFQQASMENEAAAALWLSEQWSDLVARNTPRFGEYSTLSQSAPLTIEGGSNMLSDVENAISESGEARTALSTLLDELIVSETR